MGESRTVSERSRALARQEAHHESARSLDLHGLSAGRRHRGSTDGLLTRVAASVRTGSLTIDHASEEATTMPSDAEMTRYLVLLRGINVVARTRCRWRPWRPRPRGSGLFERGHVHRQRQRDAEPPTARLTRSSAGSKRHSPFVPARQRARRGPGPDPYPASSCRQEEAQGLR